MSKELDRLIKHCEIQINLANEFGHKQHKQEHEDILKIINEYKQIKLDFDLYKDNHSYPNYEVEKLKGSLNNPLRGIFAEVTDDVLLRSNANYYAETKELKEKINQLETNIDKVSDDLQSLMNDINTKIIIGLNQFLPKLEEIQDELVCGYELERGKE